MSWKKIGQLCSRVGAILVLTMVAIVAVSGLVLPILGIRLFSIGDIIVFVFAASIGMVALGNILATSSADNQVTSKEQNATPTE
jgi:hypothetical protein